MLALTASRARKIIPGSHLRSQCDVKHALQLEGPWTLTACLIIAVGITIANTRHMCTMYTAINKQICLLVCCGVYYLWYTFIGFVSLYIF